jgi:GMP synthase PP-ATPase subunit
MRLDECEQAQKALTKHLGINLTVADASQQFLDGLKGITDPEQKRKFIGSKFIAVFEEEAKKIEAAAAHSEKAGPVEWFLQGTLYPDVIERSVKQQVSYLAMLMRPSRDFSSSLRETVPFEVVADSRTIVSPSRVPR